MPKTKSDDGWSTGDDHHFGSLRMLAVTAAGILLVTWAVTKTPFSFLQEAPIL